MKKIFVGNLPSSATEEQVSELFSQYGRVRSLRLASDIFTRQCRGFGFLEMEGHEARAAIAALNGASFGGNFIKVNFEMPKSARRR